MSAAGRETVSGTGRYASKLAVLAILLAALIGCALVNSFILIPKKGITATPAHRRIPYQEVWFQTRDRVPLNGWLIPGAPGMPLIIFFHGNGGNLSDSLDYIALFHGHGFAIFIFDYRGYGKSSGQALKEKDLYLDARAAISYLKGRGWRPERMIYYGQSLGAAVALQMTLESPPSGLVMESSFTRMKDMVRYTSSFGYLSIGWWGIDMNFDNLSKIARVGVPLLMIHGEKDSVVPVQMTRRLFMRAPGPKMLHIVNRGGHCDFLMLDRPEFLAAWNSYMLVVKMRSATRKAVRP